MFHTAVGMLRSGFFGTNADHQLNPSGTGQSGTDPFMFFSERDHVKASTFASYHCVTHIYQAGVKTQSF